MKKVEKLKRKKTEALIKFIKDNKFNDDAIFDFLNIKENISGLDVNLEEEQYAYNTPLILCSSRRYKKAANKLLEMGADPNITNIHNISALTWAAQDGELEIIKGLLKYGANIYHHQYEPYHYQYETVESIPIIALKNHKKESFIYLVLNIDNEEFLNEVHKKLISYKNDKEHTENYKYFFQDNPNFYEECEKCIENKKLNMSLERALKEKEEVNKRNKI